MKHLLAAVAAVAVVAALPAHAARQKVAVLDVRAVQGVQPGTATILTAIIAGDTSRAGYDVLSQADIGALIGFEKQKKMLGCGDDSSCLAEIGGALGAEYVMATQVGQIGSRFHLSLQVIDARRGNVVSRVATFSERTEDALAETAQRAVAEALAGAKDRAPVAKAPAAPPPAAKLPAATAVAPPPPAPAAPAPAKVAAPLPAPRSERAAVSGGDSFLARHRPYVELRGLMGLASAPTTQVGSSVTDQPGFELRVGLRWSPAWSFELGGGAHHLYVQKGRGTYTEQSFLLSRETETEAAATAKVLVGVARTIATVRSVQLAAAADAGIQLTRIDHKVLPPPGFFSLTEARAKYEETDLRFGAELRADYPVRSFLFGLRLGAEFTDISKEGVMFIDASARSFGGGTKWLDKGWLSVYRAALSARYQF